MPFQIIRNDITKVVADVIVNTANPRPVIGGGTDSAIYKAAGEAELLAERQKIGDIAPGNAVQTPAFRLKAKYIIHTVGPAWIDGKHGERDILRSCYANSLTLAAELNCKSIAFPLIATGVYGFPKDEALDIALAEIGKFLLSSEMEVTLVVFDRKALKLSEKLVGEIDQYIDEHSVGRLRRREYDWGDRDSRSNRALEEEYRLLRERRRMEDTVELADAVFADAMPKAASSAISGEFEKFKEMSLDELLKGHSEDTFQQRLFKLIDERHMKDPEVYKRANIDRKTFSKIRCDSDYHPKKTTAIALAIALKLDMAEMRDLLSRAGFAISPSSKFDLIISYFVEKKKYDIFEINMVLFEYDLPALN
ncbi:MAG: macro domain-containing protein [Flexilinea sp.]|nr:macro domain-containing protein [Flexilinea sp.]